jgi:hypothetical protein
MKCHVNVSARGRLYGPEFGMVTASHVDAAVGGKKSPDELEPLTVMREARARIKRESTPPARRTRLSSTLRILS